MATLPVVILRLAMDQQVHTATPAYGSELAIVFFKGIQTKVRVAEFDGTPFSASTLVDITGNTAATLTIRKFNQNGPKLIEKVIGVGSSLNTSLTYAQWVAGTHFHYE